nr:MAG TPA: pentapeptide repeat protein [Caudoviricetes sp.]
MSVKGYKVFNSDWTCRGKQYSCPGTFEEFVSPSVCNVGMHFCKNAADCFRYYDFNPNNHVAEVIAHGTVVEDENKCATNKLEIVREIPWAEVLEVVNTGKACTGRCNSGNWNSGNWNSGDRNSGNWNSGDRNSGNCNIGDWNSGNCNSGDWNSGDWNTTSFSNGCFNTVSPKIYMFNKPTDWTFERWFNCRARRLLNDIDDCQLEYVYLSDMTDEEKAAHPEAETTGGYLKERTTADNAQKWWAGLSADDRNVIFGLPNFDAAIFKEITGIDVSKD